MTYRVLTFVRTKYILGLLPLWTLNKVVAYFSPPSSFKTPNKGHYMRNKILLFLINYLARFIKREAPPPADFRSVWQKLYNAVGKLDSLQFEIRDVKDFKPNQVFVDFYTKALFNASAARDEMKIQLNDLEEAKANDRIRAATTSEKSVGNSN